MGNIYSFSLNCGSVFAWEDPALANIKGLFASKRKQKRREEMLETTKSIFKKYGIETKRGTFGGGLKLEINADSLEDANPKIREAVDELANWYNTEFNQKQKFDYSESKF